MATLGPSTKGPLQRVQLDRHTYEVTGLKRGGMGTVWLLRRPSEAPDATIYGRMRAVKTFEATEDGDEAIITAELGNWATLNHINIIPLIKIARLNFELAAMMPLMPGTLADFMQSRGRALDESLASSIMLDIFRALHYAQETRQVAHLDLKPNNLLLSSVNPLQIKVSDWGISRVMSQQPQHADWIRSPLAWLKRQPLDKTRYQGGTFPYMAPERFSGSWEIGPAADVFSVGMMAVQMLTGSLPSVDESNDLQRCITLITSEKYVTRAKTLLRPVRSDLGGLILKMLDPNPARRPHEYPALIAALEFENK